MSHAIRADRKQMFLLPPSLEDWVPAGHPARFVRDFVEAQDLKALGFKQSPGDEGRPHYANEMLLAVWLFGWMERIRSPRAMEKACLRDTAFIWLTGNHHPDHATLWRFFRDNKEALQKLFKRVVHVAVDAKLVGFVLHALDGTKLPIAGSMEKALHRKGLEEALEKLDAVTEQAARETEQAEQQDEPGYGMPAEMQDPKARQAAIRESLAKLDAAQVDHLSVREPEARMTKVGKNRTLGYNAQAVVDEKSDLIVAAEVHTDSTDHALLVPMLEATEQTAGRTAECTVADTGYCSGEQLAAADKKPVNALVRMQEEADTKGEYAKSRFSYDAERDAYVCPRGEVLSLQTVRQPTTTANYSIATYRCKNTECPVRAACTQDKLGRTIKRTEHEVVLERHRSRMDDPQQRALLRKRKAIVEHIFGLVKQNDGFRRFTAFGLQSARAQWALLCTVINLRKLLVHYRAGRLQWIAG